jgi:hypothetical protein
MRLVSSWLCVRHLCACAAAQSVSCSIMSHLGVVSCCARMEVAPSLVLDDFVFADAMAVC